ncbi:protein ORF114 [Lake sturgeon herpesvirus]|nr:protein ORF114 [Lake sturgeon herpesvirus]
MDIIQAIVCNTPGCLKTLSPRPLWNVDRLIPLHVRCQILNLIFDAIENKEDIELPNWAGDPWYMTVAKAIIYDVQNRQQLFLIVGACLNAMDLGHCSHAMYEKAITYSLGMQNTQNRLELSPLWFYNCVWFIQRTQITLGAKKQLLNKLFIHQYMAHKDCRNNKHMVYKEPVPAFVVLCQDTLQSMKVKHRRLGETKSPPVQLVTDCLALDPEQNTEEWQQGGCQTHICHGQKDYERYMFTENTAMSTGNDSHDETLEAPLFKKNRVFKKKKLQTSESVLKTLEVNTETTLDVRTGPHNNTAPSMTLQINLKDCFQDPRLNLAQISLYSCFICAHRKPLCFMQCCCHTMCRDCFVVLKNCPFCKKPITFKPRQIIYD